MPDGSKWNGTVDSGTENVKTVNSKSPDNTGNVQLNASDVGARPNTWTPNANDVGARPNTWLPTPQEIQALPVDGTAANANNLKGLDARHYQQPINYLHNSYFLNNQLINQPLYEYGSLISDYALSVDRWLAGSYSNRTTLSLGNMGCKLNGQLGQIHYYLPESPIGWTYVVYFTDGTCLFASGAINFHQTGTYLSAQSGNFKISVNVVAEDDYPYAVFAMEDRNTKEIYSVALYWGIYTEENIPAYWVPPYSQRLSECMQYYQVHFLELRGWDYYRQIPLYTPMIYTPSAQVIYNNSNSANPTASGIDEGMGYAAYIEIPSFDSDTIENYFFVGIVVLSVGF